MITNETENLVSLNIEPIIKKVQATLDLWRKRNLSLLGKIQVVNALIGPLFVYKMTVLPMLGEKYHSWMDTIISYFIWNNKKAKIRLKTLVGLKSQGGLSLVNLRNKEKSLKAQWVWRAQSDPHARACAEHFLSHNSKNMIWNSQLEERHSEKLFQNDFWNQVIKIWSSINIEDPIGKAEVLEETLWYNPNILINELPVYYPLWQNAGTNKIKHLRTENKWLTYDQFQTKYLITIPFTQYRGLISAIPTQWKNWLTEVNAKHEHVRIKKIEKWESNTNKVRVIYQYLNNDIELVYKRWIKIYYEVINIEYNDFVTAITKMYQITISQKLRSFHYRFLMGAIVTNIQLKHYKIKENNLCSFCETKPETIKHLFYECIHVSTIWHHLAKLFQVGALRYDQIFLNCIHLNPKRIENCITLIVKNYIYVSRCLCHRLSITGCKNAIENYKMIEEQIAKEKNKLQIHKIKWSQY